MPSPAISPAPPAPSPAPSPFARLRARFGARYLDVLASVYLYNEHRGYTALDRVVAAVRAQAPQETGFIAEIVAQRNDEHKHYNMFRRWFELRGRMPLLVGREGGHIDRFVGRAFGCTIDDLATEAVVASPAMLARLCKVIMLTEERGLKQVEVLLKNRFILADPVMRKIFRIIHQDEPGHFLPYRHWLARHGQGGVTWRDRLANWRIHMELMLWVLPKLFLNPRAPRRAVWPDAGDTALSA